MADLTASAANRARTWLGAWGQWLISAPALTVAGARGHLFGFVPVFLAIGIGVYFSLPVEPSTNQQGLVTAAVFLCLAASLRAPEGLRPLALALALVLGGIWLAGMRAQAVGGPVLTWRYYGPVEGRIVNIDRSQSDALRLTLDQVVLRDLAPERVPVRVRISLHGGAADIDPVPGLRVMLTGHLGPPGGPVEPGGFDFRRIAWFERLGAVGYTRTPVLAVARPEGGIQLWATSLRLRMSKALRDRLPGETGGFVAAILTGDRSGVSQDTTEDLRRSNLAHLLAISGLHMGLLTGVVYGGLRAALALVPVLALRLPIRKIAAIGGLAAASFYLMLSGGNIATQRAFVMAAVMLGAVLIDRQAISLRSVALAATILLAWRPEALLSAGFQMSFAATIALVAVFGALRHQRRVRLDQAVAQRGTRAKRRPGWVRAAGALIVCSLVAGLATAPVAAAHFNRIADYGLVANLLAVPLMGTLVMPSAVLAAVLWPLGLEGVGLWLMAQGTRWILLVASVVGGMEGAVRAVPAPPEWVLPGTALGALWLILWPGRSRWAGAVIAALALSGWTLAERPGVLIAEGGGLVGVMTDQGRALSRARGEGFVARAWLLADGDMTDQPTAAARAAPGPEGWRMDWGGQTWLHLHGRGAADRLPGVCNPGVTVILASRWPDAPPGDCRVLDSTALARRGALSIVLRGGTLHETDARGSAGRRPWTGMR